MTISIGTSTQLTCTQNGLEFDYCDPIPGMPTAYRDITMDLDFTAFFASNPLPGAHAVVALDTSGVNAHSFPITRHGQRMWAFARGLAFFPDGSIYFERWGTEQTYVCGGMFAVPRPKVTSWELLRGAGPVFSRLRLRVILSLDGSMQYNIEAFDSAWNLVGNLLWGQQTAALGKATLPAYTGKFACAFIDGFIDNANQCPQPTVEPTNSVSNGKNITVRVDSYSQV